MVSCLPSQNISFMRAESPAPTQCLPHREYSVTLEEKKCSLHSEQNLRNTVFVSIFSALGQCDKGGCVSRYPPRSSFHK